jgi:ATP-dependent exoDNAse (exonuclease V) alpha subunit
MRVFLTRNVNKAVDFVNGMAATVQGYDADTRSLRVLTKTGRHVAVWPWTDSDLGGITYYPVRPGYASTVPKMQGAELAHVTVYLDAANVPAAAYTAMSRVSRGTDYLIGGWVTPNHFTPAQG